MLPLQFFFLGRWDWAALGDLTGNGESTSRACESKGVRSWAATGICVLEEGSCRHKEPSTYSPLCRSSQESRSRQEENETRMGLATRKRVQGPVLRVSSRYLGLDRSAIVLSSGQTRGRETLPCSLGKIKKQETKVGRGKWGPERKRGSRKCCCFSFFLLSY